MKNWKPGVCFPTWSFSICAFDSFAQSSRSLHTSQLLFGGGRDEGDLAREKQFGILREFGSLQLRGCTATLCGLGSGSSGRRIPEPLQPGRVEALVAYLQGGPAIQVEHAGAVLVLHPEAPSTLSEAPENTRNSS